MTSDMGDLRDDAQKSKVLCFVGKIDFTSLGTVAGHNILVNICHDGERSDYVCTRGQVLLAGASTNNSEDRRVDKFKKFRDKFNGKWGHA